MTRLVVCTARQHAGITAPVGNQFFRAMSPLDGLDFCTTHCCCCCPSMCMPPCGGLAWLKCVCLPLGCYFSFKRQQHCLASVLCAQLSDSSPFVRLALLRSTCIFCRDGSPPTLALPDKRHPLLHICMSCSKACPQTSPACVQDCCLSHGLGARLSVLHGAWRYGRLFVVMC